MWFISQRQKVEKSILSIPQKCTSVYVYEKLFWSSRFKIYKTYQLCVKLTKTKWLCKKSEKKIKVKEQSASLVSLNRINLRPNCGAKWSLQEKLFWLTHVHLWFMFSATTTSQHFHLLLMWNIVSVWSTRFQNKTKFQISQNLNKMKGSSFFQVRSHFLHFSIWFECIGVLQSQK